MKNESGIDLTIKASIFQKGELKWKSE